MSLWTSRRFLVLNQTKQTNPIVENFKSNQSSAVPTVLVFFIASIKDIEKPKKIHRTSSEFLKFVAIEQGYKIPLLFLCVNDLKFFRYLKVVFFLKHINIYPLM